MSDPYLDPVTGTLRNLLNLFDRDALRQAEADLVEARALEWWGVPNPGFDQDHLCAIHRHLFQDVYEWAGQFRETGIGKGGIETFTPWSLLDDRAERVFGRLGQSPLLDRSIDDSEFLDKIAWLYLDLNHMHPFREGNGRTQRIFLNDVADVSQRVIDWTQVSREQNDQASAHSVETQSPRLLRELLSSAVLKVSDAEERREVAIRNLLEGRSQPLWYPTPPAPSGTCGAWMPRAKTTCVLPQGHRPHHRSKRPDRAR